MKCGDKSWQGMGPPAICGHHLRAINTRTSDNQIINPRALSVIYKNAEKSLAAFCSCQVESSQCIAAYNVVAVVVPQSVWVPTPRSWDDLEKGYKYVRFPGLRFEPLTFCPLPLLSFVFV